ncbi:MULTISPECIES: hypothetical protein [Chryseobacterium]|jgi:hypothetical protein|uniref:Lipoprotein n=1 Tax=Chryseobacterium lathyri TaxID=395933 RepID=A0A511YDW6_9FLAO|nr:hypothetical protein [Chryseobacterium lathyri]GEN73394.1 hypothetical protein CLA01_34660 [Chryseobacterium lathyri]
MKILTLIFFLIFFTSCSNKETAKETNLQQVKYSFENILDYGNKDTLFIKSQFEDCGEWGGHNELIKIYRSERKIKLAYIKYKVDNCGERNNMGSIIQKKDITENLILSHSQQLGLMNYINALMKSRFLDKEISNSGNSFALSNVKGDLRFSYYGDHSLPLNNYNDLMAILKFPKVVIQNR